MSSLQCSQEDPVALPVSEKAVCAEPFPDPEEKHLDE